MSVAVAKLTSKAYAASLCSKVNPMHASATSLPPYDQKTAQGAFATAQGDTIYLTTADRWGNMVSWINSNFAMGNMQVLVNILDLGANAQAAGDMARFTHAQVANTVQLETQLFDLVGQQLIGMGHKASAAGGGIAGGCQGIMVTPNPEGGPLTTCTSERDTSCGISGFYRAGSNFREDGTAVGW